MSDQTPNDPNQEPGPPGGASPPPPPPPPGQPPPVPAGSTGPSYGTADRPAAGGGAGLSMRFVARLLDGLIVGIPLSILFAIIPGIAASGIIGQAVISVASLAYFLYFETRSGQTPGKQVVSLRTVSESGQTLSMEASFRRNWWLLLGLLGGVPVIGILTGLASLAVVIGIAVTISSDPNHQGFHDKMANSVVVQAR